MRFPGRCVLAGPAGTHTVFWRPRVFGVGLLLGAAAAGCTNIPRVEVTAYVSAYTDIMAVTNGGLDIVSPYERVMIRSASPSRAVAAAGSPPLSAPLSAIVERGICTRKVTGPDPFCYEMRDGYADIGDPPLVGAYRNLANVVLRFNTVLVAYADGVSGRLLQQELSALSSSVTELSKASTSLGVVQSGAFAASFEAVLHGLAPVINIAGGFVDRAELRRFLLANQGTVDDALRAMATESVELYANVSLGTDMFRRKVAAGSDQALLTRRREIRRLISNWTVLLDDTRRLLGELKSAVETADGLETRLHNLEGTVRARIDTTAIKKQIATLGTPALGP